MDEKKFLSLKEVAKFLGLKPATIMKWVKAGRFPAPDSRLSRKVIYWKESTVEMFINSQDGENHGESRSTEG